MKLWRILHMLLPVLAIVGIMMFPLAAPAAAGMMPTEVATAMADDMPCCPPEELSVPDCSKVCPLMTACFVKCVQYQSTASGTFIAPSTLDGLAVPANDALVASLAPAPPARPPRT